MKLDIHRGNYDDKSIFRRLQPKIKKAYAVPEPYRVYRNLEHGFVLPEKYPILKRHGITLSAPRK